MWRRVLFHMYTEILVWSLEMGFLLHAEHHLCNLPHILLQCIFCCIMQYYSTYQESTEFLQELLKMTTPSNRSVFFRHVPVHCLRTFGRARVAQQPWYIRGRLIWTSVADLPSNKVHFIALVESVEPIPQVCVAINQFRYLLGQQIRKGGLYPINQPGDITWMAHDSSLHDGRCHMPILLQLRQVHGWRLERTYDSMVVKELNYCPNRIVESVKYYMYYILVSQW